MKKATKEFTAMAVVTPFLFAFMVLLGPITFSGCAVNQGGTRTVNYGVDGLTVTSETVATASSDAVEIEKEKSVQACWKEQGKISKAIEVEVAKNPFAAVMYEQAKTLNNAFSLMRTGKNYNPCPSSTNSMDADIAESAMYTSIWHDGIGAAKFLGGMWLGKEAIDSVVSGLAKAGGMALSATGGSTVNLADSGNKFTLGATSGGSTLANLFNKPIDNSVENILPEPALDATLMAATPQG